MFRDFQRDLRSFPDARTWSTLIGTPYILVSSKGIANGKSNIINDGADFGPDTPGTQTSGIQEAVTYAATITQRASGVVVVKLGSGNFAVNEDIIPPNLGQGSIIIIGADIQSTYICPATGVNCFNINIGIDIFISNLSFRNQWTGATFSANSTPASFIKYSTSTNTGSFIYLEKVVFRIIDSSISNAAIVANNSQGIYMANSYFAIDSGNSLNITNSNYFHTVNTGCEGGAITGPVETQTFIMLNAYGSIQPTLVNQNYVKISGWITAGPIIPDNSTIDMIVFEGYLNLVDYLLTLNSGSTVRYIDLKKAIVNVQSGITLSSLISTSGNIYGISGFYNNSSLPNLYYIPFIEANPPVAGTAYKNVNGSAIEIDLPVWASTTSAYGTVAYAVADSTSTLSGKEIYEFVNEHTTSTSYQLVKMYVPAGWYYEVISVTDVVLGTAIVNVR